MNGLGILFFLLSLGTTFSGVSIPKREFGFVYGKSTVSATLKIDAFLDLLCPDSGRAFDALRHIADHYGSRLHLRVHMFPLPYHRNAFLASKATFAVNRLSQGNQTYDWIATVFRSPELGAKDSSTELIYEMADMIHNLGIHREAFLDMMTGSTHLEILTRQAWKYGCSRGVHSTPWILMNEVFLPNSETISVEELKTLINRLLK